MEKNKVGDRVMGDWTWTEKNCVLIKPKLLQIGVIE